MKEYTPKIRLLVAHLGNGYIEIALEGLTKAKKANAYTKSEVA